MFKTQLIAAALALGFSGMASASITSAATGNTEFVFSAFDSTNGVGYTFDMADIGFDSIYGSNVRMNSLIGSLNNVNSVGTTLTALPASGIIFDMALPSFAEFASSANLTTLQWNVVSAESSGIRRVIQTVSTAPTATMNNLDIITAVNNYDSYIGAVNGKGTNQGGATADDGVALTVESDLTAYPGNFGSKLGGVGYSTTGGIDETLALYVLSSTTTTSNQNAGRFAELTSADGQSIVAKVYAADDGMYHLQLAVAAVPEPSTYAMLLAGLGMLGFAARRARRS